MKERPILFSAPMVRALLDGSKTQTRRVVKPEGAHHLFQFRGTTAAAGADEPTGEWGWCGSSHVVNKHIRCPYGQPGDRLWVREAWRVEKFIDNLAPRELAAGCSVVYEASGEAPAWRGKQRPSMFMPRWMSRITLEVTGVRVERLQDISEADAKAEGCPGTAPMGFCLSRIEYRELWESINGAGSWATNPWVWVVEFKRIKP